MSDHIDISDIAPTVEDVTMSPDYPEIIVRMPVFKHKKTHNTYYVAIKYEIKLGTPVHSVFLSEELMFYMIEKREAIKNSPLEFEKNTITLPGFHSIDNLHAAIKIV
jgi:hypothetical protein